MSTSVHEPKTHPKQHDKGTPGAVQAVEKEVKPLQALLRKFSNDWSMTLSAALAYNILLATFPMLVALLAVLGLLLSAFGQNATGLMLQVTSALPKEIGTANIVRGVEQNLARSSGLLSIIAVLTAIFGGSRLFILLEACFCIIYRVRPRTMIRQNLMAIGMLLVFIILVPIMAFAGSIPALAFSLLRYTPFGQNALLASVAGFLGGLIASFILFEFIYVVVPNQHVRLRHGWLGAVVAAVALQIYLLLFPLYATHFLNGLAGAIGFAAILIVFFYYFAVILILGAEVNAFFAEGVRPIPNDLATFVSTMAGRLNEDIPADEAKAHVNPKPTEVEDKEHAVDYVTETQERDVPERVAQDPEIQESVLKRKGGETGNASRSNGQRSDSSSTQKVEQPHTAKGTESSPGKSSERGAVVGAIMGAALVFLVDVLRLRRR
ncbi:MAG: YihY/virulence factor BrkB family protein [Chloroflexi bacterium]|nr:MAG: YihY/virulence factor BrkB family protein [Chloroflexota bacterium]